MKSHAGSRSPLERVAAQTLTQACNRAAVTSRIATLSLEFLERVLAEANATRNSTSPSEFASEAVFFAAAWTRQAERLRRLAEQVTSLLRVIQERAVIDDAVLASIEIAMDGQRALETGSIFNFVWEKRCRIPIAEAIDLFSRDIHRTCDAVNVEITELVADLRSRACEGHVSGGRSGRGVVER